MTVRATAALFAVLFTALPSALAWAEKAPPLRVAVVLKTQPDNAENERRLLEGFEVGMKWVYGRKLTVITPPLPRMPLSTSITSGLAMLRRARPF